MWKTNPAPSFARLFATLNRSRRLSSFGSLAMRCTTRGACTKAPDPAIRFKTPPTLRSAYLARALVEMADDSQQEVMLANQIDQGLKAVAHDRSLVGVRLTEVGANRVERYEVNSRVAVQQLVKSGDLLRR